MANGAHAGMVAYHAMLALKHDMIGMSMTAAGAQVLPTFGAEPRPPGRARLPSPPRG